MEKQIYTRYIMNILAFFAHPDDETMLAGGSLAWMTFLGARLHFLCATGGEGGEVGDPPVCARDELGDVRRKELACAMKTLGGHSLDLLGYIDPLVGPDDALFAFDASPEELADRLVHHIQRHKIYTLITHGSQGEYGHPAHRLVHQAACLAIESLKEKAPLMYTVQASFSDHPKPRLMNTADPAHLILEMGPILERKISATLCHRSQHAAFVRRSSIAAGRTLSVPEIVVHTESLHRAFPHVDITPDDPLSRLLLTSQYVRLNQ
jgi:N-acetylglucosamine malate deacetylase 2